MLSYHTGVLQPSFSCETHKPLVAGKIEIMYDIGKTFATDTSTAVRKGRQKGLYLKIFRGENCLLIGKRCQDVNVADVMHRLLPS